MSHDYRLDRTYGAFVHRELAVNWLALAVQLAGRHQLDLRDGNFSLLEFGCGQGLNLLFNAAAHPQARFFGVDLHAGHVAMAKRRAVELGLTNVSFAHTDLRVFTGFASGFGPCGDWPDQHDLVVAHGVASWVAAETRSALFQAAAQSLVPGGIFYCSYNTFPGWLSRSPFQMLALELGLQHSNNTTEQSLFDAANILQALVGPADDPLPLGRSFPELHEHIRSISRQPADYLTGEFHASHEPLYAGQMHRACASHGLELVASATLPELFPQMLDAPRRQLLEGAPTPALREVWQDLLINQTFRRDIFAKGIVPPQRVLWHSQLAELPVQLRRDRLMSLHQVSCSLGTMGLEKQLLALLHRRLEDGPCLMGELAEAAGCRLLDLLPSLSLLIHADQIGVNACGNSGADAATIHSFNQRLIDRASWNQGLGGLLLPELRTVLPLSDLQVLLAQSATTPLDDGDRLALLQMGLAMSGFVVENEAGEPMHDQQAALARLEELWRDFDRTGLAGEVSKHRLICA